MKKPIEERFWEKVQKAGKSECWLWTGTRSNGYGRLFQSGHTYVNAHRVSWTIHYGPIPKGLCVCHKCDNPPCVNPNHLFLGTHYDNNHDMVDKGRARPTGHDVRGEKSHSAKLCENDVREIRVSKLTGIELAEKFGVAQQTISAVRTGQSWRSV